MGNANRRRTFAVVLGLILTFGVVGGSFAASAMTIASDGPAAASDDAPALGQDDGTENETDDRAAEPIPITEAMEAARTETEDRNGTVVGAELGQRDGLLEFDAASVYTVDALLANGTHVEVAVNATNGSVVDAEAQEEGFLEGVFGQNQVPQQPLDLSAMYNATEAVELAQNETGGNRTSRNGTVTSVSLEQRDDALVYEVLIDQGDDGETTVVVDAMRDGQGVVEVDGEQTAGETTEDDRGEETDAGAGNETGEDGSDGGVDGGNETGEGDGDGA